MHVLGWPWPVTLHLSWPRQDAITVGEFTISRLKDYRQSYIEILNLKHAMRDELLQTWLPGIGLPCEHVNKMQEVFADFPNVRTSVTGYPDQPTVDTTWMVGWPPSSVAACTLMEELIYTTTYDGRYRDAIKCKGKIADILDYESVKREIDEVSTTLAEERSAAAAARGETPSTANGTHVPAPSATAETPETKGFHTMEEQDQDHWEKVIKKQIHTYVDIIVEKKSAAELENAIRDSTLATIKGDPTGLVLFYFDVKQSGEPLTRPELRIAPLRDANYHRMVRTVLSARAPAGAAPGLRSGEVAILLDGGRRGNATKLVAPWREGTSKDKKKPDDDDEEDDDKEEEADEESGTEVLNFSQSVINVIYSEASIASRRKKLRSVTGGIHQSEWAHMLAHSKICLPERSRKHYAGTTSGDTIMGVGAAEPDKEWTMSWAEKKALFGKKNLIAVGGKTKGASPDDVVERKTDSTQVPVTHHGMPPAWYDELIHMFFCKAIVDLTPLDAKFAWQAVLNRVGYVGIAFTEEHKSMIYARLTEQMKIEMCQPGSKLYNAQYAKATGLTETPPPVPPPNSRTRRTTRRRSVVPAPAADEAGNEDGAAEHGTGDDEHGEDGPTGAPGEEAWDPFA